jgi:hypothetical protein
MKQTDEEYLLRQCAKMLRRGQKACERQGWEKGESTEHWYHDAGTLASQIEIHLGLQGGRSKE